MPSYRVQGSCPTCGRNMWVSELQCSHCGTHLQGQFRLTRFDMLTDEQLVFLERFLRARGNIRDVERETGLSYPTVRSRLDNVLRALGLDEGPPAAGETGAGMQLELLNALSAGTVDVKTVLRMLEEGAAVEGTVQPKDRSAEGEYHE